MHVRLANQDRTGSPERRNGRRVLAGRALLEPLESRRRSDAGGVVEVLDGDRNSVQRAAPSAGADLAVGFPSRGARLITEHRDEGVQPQIVRVDSREARVDDVNR